MRDREAERSEVAGPVIVVAGIMAAVIGLLSLASWVIDMWKTWGM